MSPKQALWLGIGFTAIGVALPMVLTQLFTAWQQASEANDVLWLITFVLSRLPMLGLAFVVFSLVGFVLEAHHVSVRESGGSASPGPFGRLTARIVLITAIVLIVVGFGLETSQHNLISGVQPNVGLAGDITLVVVPIISMVALPLGLLLLPCSWLLSTIETSPAERRETVDARPE
ncbi:hypothetical protein GCM10027416_22490 [Okibacterium endophyticum]